MPGGTETRYWNHMCDFSEVQLVHTSSLWMTMHIRIEPTWWTIILRGKISSAWPGQRCPRMNPIEHAWDALGRRVAAHQPPPRTLPDLRNALRVEWELLPAEFFNHLVESMPRRIEACIAMRGNHTPY